MLINRNQAVIDYLVTCPTIKESPLYFNFINAKDNNNQFITVADSTTSQQKFIDGSVYKTYTFTLSCFKALSHNPMVKQEGYSDENIDDLSDVQALIDWVNEQDDEQNYPDFGDMCDIDRIYTTTETPNLAGIDNSVSPNLARYDVTIKVDYLDNSKRLWNK